MASGKYKQLVSNTLLFAISNFSSKLLSFFIRPYLSYALDSPDVMGVSSLLQQSANLLIPMVSLGVSYAVIRFGLDKTKDKASVFVNGFVTILLGFGIMVLASPLAKLFVGYDEGLYTLTCHAFRLFSFAFLFAGFNIFASSFFTALNNGFISAAISFLRTLVFQTSSVILLPLLFDVDGIWYAITVAEVFATIISVIFLFAKRKKYQYM